MGLIYIWIISITSILFPYIGYKSEIDFFIYSHNIWNTFHFHGICFVSIKCIYHYTYYNYFHCIVCISIVFFLFSQYFHCIVFILFPLYSFYFHLVYFISILFPWVRTSQSTVEQNRIRSCHCNTCTSLLNTKIKLSTT